MSIHVEGFWSNDCGSQLCIEVDEHGDVRGTYETPTHRTLPVVGSVVGERLFFSLDFGTMQPHLAWLGRIDSAGDALDGVWMRTDLHLSLAEAERRRATTWSPVDHFHRATPTATRH